MFLCVLWSITEMNKYHLSFICIWTWIYMCEDGTMQNKEWKNNPAVILFDPRCLTHGLVDTQEVRVALSDLIVESPRTAQWWSFKCWKKLVKLLNYLQTPVPAVLPLIELTFFTCSTGLRCMWGLQRCIKSQSLLFENHIQLNCTIDLKQKLLCHLYLWLLLWPALAFSTPDVQQSAMATWRILGHVYLIKGALSSLKHIGGHFYSLKN